MDVYKISVFHGENKYMGPALSPEAPQNRYFALGTVILMTFCELCCTHLLMFITKMQCSDI